MGGAQAGSTNRGNQADYVLGTAEGWDAFGVVRWHGVEEISHPFRYDITLQRAASAGPVDLHKLLDTGATFRIASQQSAQPSWRTIQGVIAVKGVIPFSAVSDHPSFPREFVERRYPQMVEELRRRGVPG